MYVNKHIYMYILYTSYIDITNIIILHSSAYRILSAYKIHVRHLCHSFGLQLSEGGVVVAAQELKKRQVERGRQTHGLGVRFVDEITGKLWRMYLWER